MTRDVTLTLDRALGFFGRACGLLGRSPPPPGHGLWIIPCQSIHSFGMHYPIDVVFLDRSGRVLKTVSELKPFRTAACLNAVSVIELAAGQIKAIEIQLGDRITLPASEENGR